VATTTITINTDVTLSYFVNLKQPFYINASLEANIEIRYGQFNK